MSTHSITRYRIKQAPDFADTELLMTALIRNAFNSIDHTGDEQGVGWVEHLNHLATDFSPASFMFGNVMACTLRRDVRKVQGKTVARYLAIRVARYLEETGRRPNSLARKEIKESVKADLLRKAPVDTELFHVFWLRELNEVWLMAQGDKRRALFEDHWRNTFGGSIEPMVPFVKALEMKPESAQELQINPKDSFLDNWRQTMWLGTDFLLWLWAESEKQEFFTFQSGLNLSIKFTGKMALTGEDGKVACTSRKDCWPEAHTAVIEGKKVNSARMLVTADDAEFNLTLEADALMPKSVKLPRTFAFSDEDRSEVGDLLERIRLIVELQAALDAMFRAFMELRLSQAWHDEHLPDIKVWAYTNTRTTEGSRSSIGDFIKHQDALFKKAGVDAEISVA